MASSQSTALFGALFLSCALVACGGSVLPDGADAGSEPDASTITDPDGGTDAPDAGTEVADTLAPTVTSTYPVAGATGVPINARISVTFSETMDATTLDPTSFT